MALDFYDPSYLSGVKDPDKKEEPNVESRTGMETVGDVLSVAAQPLFGLVRAGTTAAREIFPESETARSADEDAARWQRSLREHLTPYQKAVDTSSWRPEYGQRSAWSNPASKIMTDVASFAVPAAIGVATGGLGAGPAAAITAGTFGAQGVGEKLAEMRDFATGKKADGTWETPHEELIKSPVFQSALREFNGDEQAAREKFYNETKDITAAFVSGTAQGLTYGAIARLFPPAKQEAATFIGRLLAGRAGNLGYRAVQGGAETLVAGPTMGITGAYATEQQKVNAGLQPNADPHVLARAAEESTYGLAPVLVGSHVLRGRHTPLDSDIKKVAETALATDTPPQPEAEVPPVGAPGAPGSPGGFEPTTPQTFPPPPDGTRAPPAPIPGAWPDVGPPGTGPGSPPGPAGGPPPSTPPPGGGPPTPVAGPPPLPPAPAATAPPIAAAVRPPPDRAATIPPPVSSEAAAPAGPAPAPAAPAAPARAVPSPVARTEPAAGPPPTESRRAWAERILQTETDPVRRKWLEDLIRQETPAPEAPPEAPPREGAQLLGKNTAGEDIWQMPGDHRFVVNPDGTTQETMGRGVGEAGEVIDRLKTAEEVAAGTVVPSPVLPETPADKTVSDKLKARAAQIKAQRQGVPEQGGGEAPAPYATDTLGAQRAPTGVTRQREKPSVPAPETIPVTRAAPTPEVKPTAPPAETHPETTFGGRLSAEAQQHMRDQAAKTEAAKQAAVDLATKAENARLAKAAELTQVGSGRRPGKYATGPERVLEGDIAAWKKNTAKTDEQWEGLRTRARQLEGQRLAAGLGTKGYLKDIGQRPGFSKKEQAARFGQPRQAPRLEGGEPPTGPEKVLMKRIQQLHADLRPSAEMEAQTARRREGAPVVLTASQAARVAKLRTEAQRLDQVRQNAGKAPLFEKALGRIDQQRSLEQQYNDHVATLNMYRALPPDQFVRVKPVRDALTDMEAIHERLPIIPPEWVMTKLAKGTTSLTPDRHIRAFYQEARTRTEGFGRAYTREAKAVKPETAPAQKVEHTGAFPVGKTEAGRPKIQTHRQYEAEQARLREQRAPGTPEGERLRADVAKEEAAAAKRRRTPEAAYEEALARINREHELAAERAARGEQEPTDTAGRVLTGKLPSAADLKALVDRFWGVTKQRKKGKERTATTRETQYADREKVIQHDVNKILQKHLGENLEGMDELAARLEIGRKPEKPKELSEKPKSGFFGQKSSKQAIRASKSALEAHDKLRKDYEKRYAYWRVGLKDQYETAHKVKAIIDEIEAALKDDIPAMKELSAPRGGSIRWDLPEGETIKANDGRIYTRYKIGKSKGGKSDLFNLLADMLNTREHINLALARIPDSSAFDIAKPGERRNVAMASEAELQRHATDITHWLTRLSTDWRNYKDNNLAQIIEDREVRNAPIEEAKRGTSMDTTTESEEGETLSAAEKLRPLEPELTPEETIIAREEAAGVAPKHIETRQEYAARMRRENREWQGILGAYEKNLPREKRPEGLYDKPAPNFQREGPAGEAASLTGDAMAARKAELEAAYGTKLQPKGTTTKLRAQREAEITSELQRLQITETKRSAEGEERQLTDAEIEAKIDKLKNNRRNRPSDGPVPESPAEYMSEVASARDALATPDPIHPLIGDPEPARASLDRAKGILERGEGDDVSSFITPEFLDKLSTVNEGVQVLHAPIEVVRGERNEGQAFYQPNHDRIVLSNNVSSGDYLKNVAHEHVHAATENLLHTDPTFRSEVEDLRATAQRAAARQGVTNERLLYGLSDPHEFLSEASSNPEFRALIGRAAAPGKAVIHGAKTVLNALYRTVRDAWHRLVGEKDGDTALDVLFRDTSSVLGATDRLIGKTLDRLALEGRSPGSDLAVRRYMPSVGDISRKTRDKIGDAIGGRGVSDIVMGLHTTIDFTHRGEKEFQGHVTRVARVMAKTHTDRTRIMAEENEPKLRETAKWLNGLADGTRLKVEKFLHDETMHTADASVDLAHRSNKHIGKTELADVQTRRMHDQPGVVDKEGNPLGMRQRYNELAAQVPGFVEHRKLLHDFFTTMENNVRDAVTRALIEHLRLLPKDADTPAKKEAAVNLIQKHILGEKLTAGEKTRLEAIKSEAGRRNFRDIVSRIRRTPELTRIAGPYIPLTRHGEWAVSGLFKLPEGGRDGERLTDTKDRQGRPVDDGIRLFDTRAEAEAFEQRMHDKFGISQVDGGEWFLDQRTGKRAREFTEEEMKTYDEELRRQFPDLHNRLLKAKEIEGKPGTVREGPDVYEKKYWIKMQPQLLEFHERKSEAQASTDAWRKRHGNDIDVTEPEPVHRGLGKQNEKYASTQMQKLIDRAETAPSFTDLAKDQQANLIRTLTLQAAKLSLRRGVRQQFKPRGYVLGHDPQDLVRNAYDYSGQTSGYLANTRNYVEKMEARKALDDYMHETRYDNASTHTAHVQMRDELYRKMDEPAENNTEGLVDRSTNVLLKWSLLKQLPGFSYFTANATEVAALGAPIMMDRHGPLQVYGKVGQSYRIFGGNLAPFTAMTRGIVDAIRTGRGRGDLVTKWKDYVNTAIDRRAPAQFKEGLTRFFGKVHEIGLMEPSTGIEYQKSLYNPSASVIERAADWAANVFQAANSAIENLNRFVTGSSAYMLEVSRQLREGKSAEEAHQAAENYAIDVMYRTNGDARDWNKPSLFNKGPVLRLATQYKSFPQRVMASFIDSGVASLRLTTKAGRENPENWEKGRRLAAMAMVTVGAAGVLGLPTEVLKVPLNAMYLLGLSNWNSDDAEAHFRQWTATKFGLPGRLLADGFSAATPFDFQSKLTQANTFFYGAPQSRKTNDLMASAFGVIAGAGGHTFVQAKEGISLIVQGIQQMNDGATTQGWLTIQKGLQRALPVKALADAFSISDSLEARVSPAGKVTRQPLTTVETIGQAMGFQPQRMSEERFRKEVVKGEADRFTAERSRLIHEYAQASTAQRASIQRSIDEFNRLYPSPKQKITRSDTLKAEQTLKKAQTAPPDLMGLTLTPRTMPFLRDTPAYR